MDSRGVSHIEVIFAFVIFVGFLVFALFFFNPLDTGRVVDSVLYYVSDEVTDNTSVSVESFSIVIDDSVANVVGIPLSDVDGVSRVESQDGAVLDSTYASQVLSVDRAGNDYVLASFSEDFPTGASVSGTLLASDEYTISSSEVRDVLSESRVSALKNVYDTDYQMLKTDFNIPGRANFGFALMFDDGTVIEATRAAPEGVPIESEQSQVEVMRTDGSIVFAELRISVW